MSFPRSTTYCEIALRLIVVLALLSEIVGCSVKRSLESPRRVGFIEYSECGRVYNELPFFYLWLAEEFKVGNPLSGKVFVAPVDAKFLPENGWRASIAAVTSEKSYLTKIDKVTRVFRQKVIAELTRYTEDSHIVVTDQREEADLLLEIVLTEAVLADPAVYAVSFMVPLPLTSAIISGTTRPSIGIEARLTAAKNNKLLVAIADRKFTRYRPIIDLNRFTVTSPMVDIVERYATDIRKLVTRQNRGRIRPTCGISLLPW